MADPLSISAGVIGIVSLAAQITQLVYKLELDWKEAPATVKTFLAELQTLQRMSTITSEKLLQNPDFVAAFTDRQSLTLSQFNREDASSEHLLDLCTTALEDLSTELRKVCAGGIRGWKRIKSAILAKNTQQAVINLSRQFRTLNDTIIVDTALISAQTLGLVKHVKDISSKQHASISSQFTMMAKIQSDVEQISQNRMHESERDILDWLTTSDYSSIHEDFENERWSSTGQWMLQSEEFKDWVAGYEKTLFGSGEPGSGKTMLVTTAVTHLESLFRNTPNIGIAYVYCNFRRKREQSPRDILACVLKQLAQRTVQLPAAVKDLFELHSSKRTNPSFEELSTVISLVAGSTFTRSFIFLDALDEFGFKASDRKRLLNEIFNLQDVCSISLFATSRNIPDIVREFRDCSCLDIRAQTEDMEVYLRGRMIDMPKVVQRSIDIQDQIVTAIVSAAGGMFLLAKLHVDSLVGSRSVKAVKNRLGALPSGSNAYDSAYNETMQRIQNQHPEVRKLALEVLLWISHAARPLTTTELCCALAIELDTFEFDDENMPETEDLVSACLGLVVVDEISNGIRLVHYTTQEYLGRTSTQWFPNGNFHIAERCLTYLCYDIFSREAIFDEEDISSRCTAYPFLLYVTKYWGLHCRDTPAEVGKRLKLFFENTNAADNAAQTMFKPWVNEQGLVRYGQARRNVTGYHFAAYFGLQNTFDVLLGLSNEMNCQNSCGETPLMYAAGRGSRSIVMSLLSRDDIEPNVKDWNGQTALSWVTTSHEDDSDMVALLLNQSNINPDSVDYSGRTPLSWAAFYGHQKIVKLLLDRSDVNSESRDKSGQTPFSQAASRGNKAIVEIFLAHADVDVNSKDVNQQTPLMSATLSGADDVVEILLARLEIDPDSKNNGGQTALSIAASYGREKIVKLLLSRSDVSPDSIDIQGRTPLSLAVQRNKKVVVELLLTRPGVDPNSRDVQGFTPLSWAAYCGLDEIVELLLNRFDIRPDSKDSENRTPLSFAVEMNHRGIVQLLLARSDVDPNFKDIEGRPPLSWAEDDAWEEMLELFRARSDFQHDLEDQ